MKPLAIDLYCGLGGWTEGLLAEGWTVVGIDIEEHVYGEHRYPAGLIIQDVLTVTGSAFSEVDLIVASPPCQEYSYMAMPWTRAKAKAAAIRADTTGSEIERLNRLFNACFRIQREASAAAGRHIPMVVENVKGAQPWVGRARWSFGSFFLWGDVPALMPAVVKAQKFNPDGTNHGPGSWFAVADSKNRGSKNSGGSWFAVAHNTKSGVGQNPDGRKLPGFRFDGSGRSFQTASVVESGVKAPGMNWSNRELRGQDFTRIAGKHAATDEGVKNGNDWFGPGLNCSAQRRASSGSNARKAASAMIAKIPLTLSRHIARSFWHGGYGARSEAIP